MREHHLFGLLRPASQVENRLAPPRIGNEEGTIKHIIPLDWTETTARPSAVKVCTRFSTLRCALVWLGLLLTLVIPRPP